jgi:hypothetical protein
MRFVASHTMLNDYETCPRKMYLKHISRDYPFEASEHLVWGREVHKGFEHRLRNGVDLPDTMRQFEPLAAAVAKIGPIVLTEAGWTITKDGRAMPWGYRGADAWYKAKLDTVIFNESYTVAVDVDWKTGKRREDPAELAGQALVLKRAFPKLQRISAMYMWLNELSPGVMYHFEDPVATVQPHLEHVIAAIDETLTAGDEFIPTPGPLCGWCACVASNSTAPATLPRCKFGKKG